MKLDDPFSDKGSIPQRRDGDGQQLAGGGLQMLSLLVATLRWTTNKFSQFKSNFGSSRNARRPDEVPGTSRSLVPSRSCDGEPVQHWKDERVLQAHLIEASRDRHQCVLAV